MSFETALKTLRILGKKNLTKALFPLNFRTAVSPIGEIMYAQTILPESLRNDVEAITGFIQLRHVLTDFYATRLPTEIQDEFSEEQAERDLIGSVLLPSDVFGFHFIYIVFTIAVFLWKGREQIDRLLEGVVNATLKRLDPANERVLVAEITQRGKRETTYISREVYDELRDRGKLENFIKKLVEQSK